MLEDRHFFEGMLELLSNSNEIVIYGAGYYGQLLLKKLHSYGMYKKGCFAESNISDKKEIMGWTICDISEFAQCASRTVVIVAVGTKYVEEMKTRLEQLDIKNYFVLTDNMRKELRNFEKQISGDFILECDLNLVGPLVSVLVPIYNTEKYLEQCLESLCMQSFTNFEVICINDGSTDNSLAIIKKFIERDLRFRVINKHNTGYGDSMNQGIKAARGKYIAILESDDFAEKDMLQRLITTAEVNATDIVVGNYYIFHDVEKRSEYYEMMWKLSKTYGRILTKDEQYILASITPSIWKGLYRKRFLEMKGVDFLPTPGASYQDTSFAFKAYISADRVIALKEPVLYYRRGHVTASVKDVSKVFCICDEFMEIKRYIEVYGCKEWYPAYAQSLLDRYYWNYNRIEGNAKIEFLSRYIEEIRECVSKGWLSKEKVVNRDEGIFGNVFE